MEENKNINAETLGAEAHGYFKGERKRQIENAEEKIMQLLKDEGLSMVQARTVLRSVSYKLKKQEEILLASTVVE